MVKVYENLTVRKEILDELKRPRRARVGWHVWDLICCPRRTYYKMTGKPIQFKDTTALLFARGKAHHSVLEVYPDKEIPKHRNGIAGTIDMKGERICEIFTTVLSSKKVKTPEDAPKVFPLKTRQLESYLYMSDEDEGDLVVFHLFGDYSRFSTDENGKVIYVGITPELKVWTMHFDEDELIENWGRLLDNRDLIMHHLKLGTPPEAMGEPFECPNCGYAYLCPLSKEVMQLETLYRRLKDVLRV